MSCKHRNQDISDSVGQKYLRGIVCGMREYPAPQRPKIPKVLTALRVNALIDFAEVSGAKITGADWVAAEAQNVVLEESQLTRILLTSARLPKLRLRDVRVEGSDFSAAHLEQTHFSRVKMRSSRLLGVQFLDADLNDVVFQDCNLDGAVFASVRGKHLRFENCQLKNAAFESAVFEKITFSRCDLRHASFFNIKLKDADLRGSNIDGMQITPEAVKGMVITSSQALQMVGLLGVVVKDGEL